MKQQNIQNYWLIFGVIVAIAALYFLAPIISPFILGAIVAYMFDPIINAMVKIRIPRTVSILIVFIIGLILLLLLLGGLIPLLDKQLLALLNKTPLLFSWLGQKFHLQFDFMTIKTALINHLKDHGNLVKNLTLTIMSSGKAFFELMVNIVLIPIVAFYLLRDWSKVTKNFTTLLPRHNQAKIMKIISDCGEVLGSFFRGQLLVMFGLGIIYVVGLTIVGLDLSLLIGILAGFLSIVPYLGFMIGFVISIFDVVIKYHAWWPVIAVCIVFAVGHVAESYILQPWLVGNRIGLHPVAVIFAVMAGGVLFGFMGVVIALPVAAVVMVLLRYLYHYYLHTNYYEQTG